MHACVHVGERACVQVCACGSRCLPVRVKAMLFLRKAMGKVMLFLQIAMGKVIPFLKTELNF